MKVYIAGKVTDLPPHTTALKFAFAEKKVRKLGYKAVNPIKLVGDIKAPWGLAMRKCIAALTKCDLLVTLPDCDTSPGAKLEIDIAQKLGMRIFKIDELPYKMKL